MPYNFFGNLTIPGPNGTLPVPHQLLHRNTTTVNQILGLPGMFSTFSARNLRNLRILALTSSSLSIVSCSISIFCLLNIDKRKRMFRHDLIFFLFICDLVKALVLMIYPLVILVRNDVYSMPQFYNTLGWFTAYCVEGADLAIFFFAIHFALLIFKPSWIWRNKRSSKMEGGLYQLRAFIWPITALVPLIWASLAFVNFKFIDVQMLIENTTVVFDNNNYNFDDFAKLGGYKPYSAWCYLPPYPLWYKLVLSWGPRYFLIIFIFTLYLSIYIFVRRQSRRIRSQIYDFKHKAKDDQEKAKIRTYQGMLLWVMKKYLYNPFLHFLANLKNFFFLNLEDTADSSRGRSLAGSITSSRADESASFRYKNSIVANGDHAYFGTEYQLNAIAHERASAYGFSKEYTLKPCKSLSDLPNHDDLAPQHIPRRISTTGQEFWRHSDNDIPRASYFQSKDAKLTHVGHSCFNLTTINFPSSVEAPTKNSGNLQPDPHNYQYPNEKTKPKEKNSLNEVQALFQKQTYADMKKRRMQIQRNLRSIFVYPFSYIAIWVFPLIVDATQYNYEIVHGPIVWLVYLATIAQPLNGFVDTMVFLYREKPWKCSWHEVQMKELTDRYILKGSLDDKDIYELYNSGWGKKGWYYCGRFQKRDCWRHKPQRWKRMVWYARRFVTGFFKNDYNFEDNCDDTSFWNNYYLFDRMSSSKAFPKERQFSFPSDSTNASDFCNNGLSYVAVPTFWKLLHFFPMLQGIDLDELNRQLRLKSMNDEVNPSANKKQFSAAERHRQKADSSNLFKPNYSLKTPSFADNDRLLPRRAQHMGPSSMSTKFNIDLDFSDMIAHPERHSEVVDDYHLTQDAENDDMDVLAFLKGSDSMA